MYFSEKSIIHQSKTPHEELGRLEMNI